MKKINYEELGKYLKSECEKEFGIWFSDYWRYYEEELTNANVIKEENGLIYEYIEITQNGKILNIELIYSPEEDIYYI